MKHVFQINKKLAFISFVLMIIFISSYLGLINVILDKVIQLTAEVHYNQVTTELTKDIAILRSTIEKISSNQKIIHILNNNRSFDQLDNNEKNTLMDQINLYEQYLESSPYIDTVNIVSLSGNYLFSKGHIYENFILKDRPWYKKAYLDNQQPIIITDIHKDLTTNKDTIAMISFIYTPNGKELLGAAILDIYVDDLVESIEASFHVGTLEAFLLPHEQINDVLNTNKSSTENYIKYAYNILSNENGILLSFNKASIKNHYMIKPILIYTQIVVFIVGLLISISLIISIRITFFKPASVSIDKLKHLLDTLDDKDETSLSSMDEIEQLKVISATIGKSFDNKVQSLIYHDALTGMPNRKKMMHICKELIQKQQSFALAFIDLNKFKKVNDIYGHSVGDLFLITFSKILQQALGDKGVLIRYSGDEFIIIYKDFISDEDFIRFYENEVVPLFIKPILLQENIKIPIEFSTGVAVYPRDGLDIEDLINKSDFMMYTSKSDPHPYKLLFFNQDIYREMMYIETLKHELKFAIKNNELIINYQPIFDANQCVVKAEALLRFHNKVLGNIPPTNFIHYAEETRTIIPIGYWIIEEVCKFIQYQHLDISIGINVSPIQLLEPDFITKTKGILDNYTINTKQIYFEITESVLLDDSEIVASNINNLRTLGIAIALDDFGTGYASFNYLKKYNLDILKIDKLFLDNASNDDYELIGYLKKIANLLKMKVVIEGVETIDQFNKLKKIGCNFFQGYYFSKPLTEQELLEFLSTHQNNSNKL
nr:EAL domain-containing protein [uncultured Niameybacter sp.]